MIYAIFVIAALILDQAVKFWTNKTLVVGEAKAIIPGVIEFLHTQNRGAAFGLFDDVPAARWAFVVLVAVFTVAVIVILSKNIIKAPAGRWLLVLILAGGLGNCIDRIFSGYVVDMFHFEFLIFGEDFAIFNVADIFITVGGLLFCVWLVFHKPEVKALAEGPASRSRRVEDRTRTHRTGDRAQTQDNGDYITQLKKPVARAREDLERERTAEARRAAAAEARRAEAQRPRPVSADPFDEFVSEAKSAPAPVRRDVHIAPPRTAPAPAPAPAAPPAPAPKKSEGEFTLEDILAEFK